MLNKFAEICKSRKVLITITAIALLFSIMGSMTYAYLKAESNSVKNGFSPYVKGLDIKEDFDGTVKKNVTAKNDGNSPIYVRIQLVSYRVNDAGNRIGGTSSVPTFTPGSGWLNQGDNIYVYSKPVDAGATAPYLIGNSGITLASSYSDADGGKQAIDVTAQSVDASNKEAVSAAWNVNISAAGVITLK